MRSEPEKAPTSPAEAVALLLRYVAPVTETETTDDPTGRILAEPLRADRDQPPADLSLMDGFAVRVSALRAGALPITGEARAGEDPGEIPSQGVVRIVTGAGLPRGADAVIKREDADESSGAITITDAVVSATVLGRYVRPRASSARAGDEIAPAGAHVTPTLRAAAALFGRTNLVVRRKVRIGLLATGDEVVDECATFVSAWRVRDASAPAFLAVFSGAQWCDSIYRAHAPDVLETLVSTLQTLVSSCDAVFLAGGFSKGHRDHVPTAIEAVGGRILFHRLPQRPGHPALGATTPDGKAIIGLPGNPMSSLCVARRVGAPVLRHIAGATSAQTQTLVILRESINKPADHWRFRPASLLGNGEAALATLAGSADVAGAAQTDGFVEIPPDATGAGPFLFYEWVVR
jgi:molybdopterin molybdotransferase